MRSETDFLTDIELVINLRITNPQSDMSDSPNKLSQFWSELKRRKVLRSLAIYAGTAFIILEACNMLFPRWDLPDWTIDLVFWLLVLGAFINVIIAWIYDITPGGMRRTKPVEELTRKKEFQIPEDGKPPPISAW